MDVMPAVDVLGGSVVRLMQGDYDRVTTYSRAPVAAAQYWLDEGAGLVHVVDLDGARSGVGDVQTWAALGAAGIPYQLGGGVRTAASVADAIAAGAHRVILGTAAVWQPEVLAAAIDASGVAAVVASIDVREGRATGAGWLDEGRSVDEVVESALLAGTRQFLVTAVAQDGTMRGPDITLLGSVIAQTDGAYVMCAGGIGTLDHVRAVRDAGAAGVVLGRSLYEGAFTLGAALAVAGE